MKNENIPEPKNRAERRALAKHKGKDNIVIVRSAPDNIGKLSRAWKGKFNPNK